MRFVYAILQFVETRMLMGHQMAEIIKREFPDLPASAPKEDVSALRL